MKKILLISGWLLLFNCLSNVSFSQTTPAASGVKELILAIPLITDKNIDAVKNTLIHTSGITTYGYCSAHKCFLITYDPAVFESGETIAAMVETAYPELKTEIKIGATIAQLIDNCTHYPLPAVGTTR